MKTALVHDWLVGLGGAENVLEEIFSMYPESDIYTMFSDPAYIKTTKLPPARVHNSYLQNIPKIQSVYRKIPNLFPMAIEEFDLTGYDVVLSSSHAAAKGVLTDSKTCHISYIHSPMRYIWDLTFEYLKGINPEPLRWYTKKVFHNLRIWDAASSLRPDYLIANSHYIKRRIKKIYRRDAEVIYPPVELSGVIYNDKKDYYAASSRLVPYKNIPLIAESFAKMPDKKLIIIGDGPDKSKVEAICTKAKNIEYMGFQKRDVLMKTIGEAKAFIFAAEEDFGIMPVEAQSLGTPVIAYGVGGATESVVSGVTGMFFDEQSTDSIIKAVNNFENNEDRFDYGKIAEHSKNFSTEQFKSKLDDFVKRSYEEFRNDWE